MANTLTVIGKYRIVTELSSGSFGRVYLGEDTSRNNAPVAVKLLHASHVSSQQERNGFLQEARFLTLLRHPYILQVLDVGIEQEFPYIVTEYATNGSLLLRLKKLAPRPLPLKDVLSVLGQVGQALQYAHQQNIIHRDLKPANILFNARGDALLADFGVATMLANSSEHGTAIGTPYYMAPEQFRGTISKESDQYALGCIAYELVTGRLPFNAADFFSLGYKHMSEIPIPPSQLNLLVSRSVESAILRAMAKQRSDRFPDIASFMAALGVPLPEITSVPTPLIPLPPPQSSHVDNAEDDEDEGDLTFRRALFPAEDSITLANVQPSASQPVPHPTIVREESGTSGAMPIAAMLSSMPLYTGAEDAPQAFSPAVSLPREIDGAFTPRLGQMTPITLVPANNGDEDDEEGTRSLPPLLPITGQPSRSEENDEVEDLPAAMVTPAVAIVPLAAMAATLPPSKPRKKRRILFIIAAALLLFLLLGGSAFAALYVTNSSFRHSTANITSTLRKNIPVVGHIIPAPTPTATVTITPVQKSLSYNYTIQASGVRYPSNATGWQSRTIPATGKGTIAATYASGTLSVKNYNSYSVSLNAGLVFYDKAFSATINSSIVVPGNSTGYVTAHATNAGASGNIGVNTFYGCSKANICVDNTTAFTGGQDAQTYTYLQASDMNAAASAANQLKASLIASAYANVQGQIYAGETLYGSIQCSSSVTYNHSAGQRVSSVTTSVSAKCSAEVYNQQAALSTAASLLQQQVSSVPNASYTLVSRIATSILSVSGTNGGIVLVVNASSIGRFQFSKAQRQEFSSLIAGKSEQNAQAILSNQAGVGTVKIRLDNTTGTTLPTDATNITINVVGN